MDDVIEPAGLPAISETPIPGLPAGTDDVLAEHAREMAEAARGRLAQKHSRYVVAVRQNENGSYGISPSPLTGGFEADVIRQLDAFGSTSVDFVQERMRELIALASRRGSPQAIEQTLNAALALVDGIQPENETEALLATQMAATHETAMRMLKRAAEVSDPRLVQECGTLATKMLRTYAVQMETLSKVRRKGEQKVRVEHVHVHEGGQAIVGNVTTGVPLPGISSKGP